MLSDEEIVVILTPLRPIDYRKIPIEGTWRHDPFAACDVDDRTLAVVCEDPDVMMLVVDRRSGEVCMVDGDGELDVVNSSLQLLVRCSRAFQKVSRAARLVEDDDEALEALAARLLAEVQRIDAAAVRHENQFWSTTIEEIEYGI